MKRGNANSFFLRYLLLVVFIGYYASISMFYHSHIVYGHVLSHSHPYKTSPDKGIPFQPHTHTSDAFNLIQGLNDSAFIGSNEYSELPDRAVIYLDKITYYSSSPVKQISFTHPDLRAPPLS